MRGGGRVTLTWTMPLKNTDKMPLKGPLQAHICCRANAESACVAAGNDVEAAPGAKAEWIDTLPEEWTTGSARALTYFVEVRRPHGRSAGLSNSASVVAGGAPAAVQGLKAEMRRNGVLLRWTAIAGDDAMVRLVRVRPDAAKEEKKEKRNLLDPEPEAAERTLRVDAGPQGDLGKALDTQAHFGQTYAYRAQRVRRATVDGKAVELASEMSAPVRIVAENIFAPLAPAGLVAVAASEEQSAAIDLNWQPMDDAEVAGYIVYRKDGDEAWRRVSAAELLTVPAYRDAHVEAGHKYLYAVTAVGKNGRESERSAEATESLAAQ